MAGEFSQLLRRAPPPEEEEDRPPLRRERGIGPWTLGALGLAGAGVALARRPDIAAKLMKGWQRPLYGLERFTKDRPVEIGGKIPGLPSELPLLRRDPQSLLVSDTERIGASMAGRTRELLDKPWSQELRVQDPERIKDIEHTAVSGFLSRLATGMTPSQAKAAALAATPQWFQEANVWRAQQLFASEGEQWAKRFMGLERIPERWGPYMPRQTIRTESASLRGRGGFSGELRTSLAGAERERVYPTMRAGEQAGVRYDDPRVAWLNREVVGMRLVETAKYLQRLENRVVFRNRFDAEAVAGTRKVYRLEGLPGNQEWWVPHYEEWKFMTDNLRDPDFGTLGFLRNWSNAMARNPNLINPLPHIVKNMAYKYRMAGGKLSQLPTDFAEFRRGTSPMVVQFNRFMPHSPEGETAAGMFQRAVHGIRRESYPAPVKLVDLALDATIGRMHRASSKVIFGLADPAMRFSLWKQYVAKGYSGAEAAQHVWIDLIRYGTRSTLVDAWKSIPFNFFVPWRLGTTTTLFKQLTDHPWRTAAFVGAIDLVREIRYRQTGRWTHLPIDYIEMPIAQLIQSKDRNDAALSLIAATLGTVAFGPGGGFAAAMLIEVLGPLTGRSNAYQWGYLKNMFWGLSQMIDGGKSAVSIFNDMVKGDTRSAVRDATNLLMTAATAEHSALNYRPRRLLAALPEVGPGLQKSAQVKLAEAMQQKAEMGGERAQARRERRKGRGSIEERIKALTTGD